MLTTIRISRGYRQSLKWFVTMLATIGLGSQTVAQEATTPIQFRRVYAPADRAHELAKDGTWTVRRDEFERLVQAVNEGAYRGRTALKSRIESQVLKARYDHQQHAFVEGAGVLAVTHNGDEPAFLPISSFRMAIESARWKDDPDSAARIVLGPDGAMLLHVDRTGEIEFQWSLRGVADENQTTFDFRAIGCPRFEMEIQTPVNTRMRSSKGVVVKRNAGDDPSEESEQNLQEWTLIGPATGETKITLETTEIEDSENVNPALHRTTTYEFNRRGFRYASQFHIEAVNESLRSIPLHVDDGLRLTSAYLGDERIEITTADSNGLHWLHLPESTVGKRLSLRIQGGGGVFKDKATLPKVTCPQMTWLNETIMFEVASPLTFSSLQTEGCRQTKFEEVGPALTRYRFDAYDRDYSIAVATRVPSEKILASSMVNAHWGRANINADWVTKLQVRDGIRFEVRLPIPSGWIVDSVRTEPVDRLESWRVDQQGREIQIIFRHAVTADQPVEIIGRAYRRSSIEPMSQQDFSFGQIPDIDEQERIISITTDSADELRVSNDHHVEVLSPEDLNDEFNLGIASNAFVFRTTRKSTLSRFELRPKSPHFSAELILWAQLGPTTCAHQWRVKCEPEGAALTHVDLLFQHPLPAQVQWSLTGEDSTPLVAERLAVGGDQSERWRILLPRPSLDAFELQSDFSQLHTGSAAISLARVENADTQNGTIVLGAVEDVTLGVDSDGLRPTPMAPDAGINDRLTFTYNPSGRAALTLRKHVETDLEATRIWRQRSETFWSDSKILHHLEIRIENFGARFITAKLPPNTTLNSLIVNGQTASPALATGDQNEVAIRLPPDERFVLVEATFSSPATPLFIWGDIAPPTIEFSCPVSQVEQILWTPPEIEPQSKADEPTTWGNIAHRLFGSTTRQYEPFRVIDFLEIADNKTTIDDAAKDAKLAEIISQLHITHTKPRWGDFVKAYRKHANQSSDLPRLIIDQAAFTRWRIGPETPLPRLPGAPSNATVSRWINEQGVDRVWFTDGLLFTSPAVVGAIRSGSHGHQPIRGESSTLSKYGVSTRTEAQWFQDKNTTPDWLAPTLTMVNPELSDWNCMIVTANAGEHRDFSVVRPYRANTAERIAVLLCSGVMLLFGGRRLRVFFPIIGATIILSLLAPIEWVALPRSILWGAVAATGLTLGWRRLPVANSSAISTASLLLVAFLVLRCNAPLIGQEAEVKDDSRVIWPVIFPVDEKGNPAGEYCFPAKVFYDALQQQADQYRTQSRDWLFVDVNWLIDLNDRNSGEPEFSPEIIGEIKFIANRPNVKVLAPVDRSVLLLTPDGATLDGESVDLRTEEAGLSFVVKEKGEHLVRIAFRGLVQSRKNIRSVRFKTPPIPMTTIRVNADTGLNTIEFPESLGVVTIDRETGELVAANGPRKTIALEWPFAGQEIALPEVRQRAWVYVNPNGVTCDHKINVEVPKTTSINEIVFAANHPIKLQGKSEESPISKIGLIEGNRIAVTLDRPYVDESFELSFSTFLKDSPIGTTLLPRLHPLDLKLMDNVTAITVDPQFNFAPLTDTASTSTNDFAELWPSGVEPDWAMRSSDTRDVSILISPAEKIVDVESSLTAVVGPANSNVFYNAKIDYGGLHQWRVNLNTTGLNKINAVEVQAQGEPVDCTWSVDEEQRISVLAKSPFFGEVDVQISGSSKIDNAARWRLPEIAITNTMSDSHVVRVFREDGASVRVVKLTGFEPLADEDSQPVRAQRRVGSWRRDFAKASSAIELNVRPNRPLANVDVVFSMINEGDQWFAEAEVLVSSKRGILDSVRFHAPRWWADRIESAPQAEISVSLAAEKEQKIVEFRPVDPISKSRRFRIRGEVLAAAGRRIQLPQIQFINCELNNLLVVVPRESGNRRLNWRLSNLMPATLPKDFALPETGESLEVFRSESANSQAVLQTIRTVSDAPLIRLADVRIEAGSNGTYQGSATFDLSPAGMRSCTILATEGVRLEQIRIDDRPATVDQIEENRVRVTLVDEQLPQRIDVLFAGDSTALGHFSSPRVQQVKTKETLWTVHVVERNRSLILDNNRKSPNELRLRRYRAACDLVGASVNATSEKSLGEASAWYMPWMRRLARLRTALVAENESPEELRALELEQVDIASRLGLESVRQAAINSSSREPGIVDLTLRAGGSGALGWAFQGEKSSLQTPVATASILPFDGRLIIVAGAVGLMSLFLFWASGNQAAVSLLYRWPYATLALLGVLWWLAAFPGSIAGIIVALLASLGSLRSPWRRTRDI